VDGGVVRQFKALYGTTLITGFAHVGGHLVGIVANVGEMTTEACLKVRRGVSEGGGSESVREEEVEGVREREGEC